MRKQSGVCMAGANPWRRRIFNPIFPLHEMQPHIQRIHVNRVERFREASAGVIHLSFSAVNSSAWNSLQPPYLKYKQAQARAVGRFRRQYGPTPVVSAMNTQYMGIIIGLVTLPKLSDGSHSITAFGDLEANGVPYLAQATVYFTYKEVKQEEGESKEEK